MVLGDLALGLSFPLAQLVICSTHLLFLVLRSTPDNYQVGSFKDIGSTYTRELAASLKSPTQFSPKF